MTGAAVVIRGDAGRLPLPDGSVDLIVTSPPYFSLRSYTDAGAHYDGQIGSELTAAEYIANLVRCTREWVRVLKPAGSLFVNLGDKYGRGTRVTVHGTGSKTAYVDNGGPGSCIPTGHDKSLLGLPWRYALACTDELGLILRRDFIWSKKNSIPESVKDRARTAHEYLFHLTKQPRYYSSVDEIREDHDPASYARFAPGQLQAGLSRRSDYGGQPAHTFSLENSLHPLGRLPGSVWEFPLQPLFGPACRLVWDGRTIRWFGTWDEGRKHMRMLAREWWAWPAGSGRPSLRSEAEHFAAFPMELPRKVIQGWSPAGVCTGCGQGRRPVSVVTGRHASGYDTRVVPMSRDGVHGHDGRGGQKILTSRGITGYVCDCTPFTGHPERRGKDFHDQSTRPERGRNDGNGGERFRRYVEELNNPRGPVREYDFDSWEPAPTRPAVVLDPFGGTGCTAMVAAANGRIGISVDYSHSYSRFARWRTNDPSERAKAMQVRKPPPPPDPRQEALFGVEDL